MAAAGNARLANPALGADSALCHPTTEPAARASAGGLPAGVRILLLRLADGICSGCFASYRPHLYAAPVVSARHPERPFIRSVLLFPRHTQIVGRVVGSQGFMAVTLLI